jgi:hypothetical protein
MAISPQIYSLIASRLLTDPDFITRLYSATTDDLLKNIFSDALLQGDETPDPALLQGLVAEFKAKKHLDIKSLAQGYLGGVQPKVI